MYDPSNPSAPGSITQVRECTMKLMQYAKEAGISVLLVGHINKDGNIAGPKLLEHMSIRFLHLKESGIMLTGCSEHQRTDLGLQMR